MGVEKRGNIDHRPVNIPWRKDIEKLLGMNEVLKLGEVQMSRMGVILRDSHRDERIEIYSDECDYTEAGICRRIMRGKR